MQLIDVGEALMRVTDAPVRTMDSLTTKAFIYAAIKTLPTIDAEPVVHGRWSKQKDGTLDCSACRSTAPYKEDWYGEVIEAPIYPRCPYCGAIMDGGGSK